MKERIKELKLHIISAIGAIAVIVYASGQLGAGEFLNNHMAFGGYGGGGTLLPQPIVAVNNPLYLPDQREGRLFHKADNNMLLELEIAPDSINTVLKTDGRVVFESEDLLADSVIEPVLEGKNVYIVGGRVFSLTARNEEDGALIRYFPNDLALSITIPELPQDTFNLGVYYLNANNVWRLIDQANFDPTNKATVKIDTLAVVAVLNAPGLPDRIEAAGNYFPTNQVLGVRTYPVGTLLRTPDNQIYVVKDIGGYHLTHIPSLRELQEYAGQPIVNVGQEVIDFYQGREPVIDDLNRRPVVEADAANQNVAGIKYYADGALLRTPDLKVYLVENPTVRHVATLPKNLRHYAGRRIYEIEQIDLELYRSERIVDETEKVLGAVKYGEGSLLRTRDWKVYEVADGTVKHIATLPLATQDTYQGKRIHDVDYGTLNEYKNSRLTVLSERVLGVKDYANGTLLRSPDGKVYIIENGRPRHILTIDELRSYGNRPILNVTQQEIENSLNVQPPVVDDGKLIGGPQKVLGVKQYPNGTILRTKDWKVYEVIDGQVKMIALIPGPRDNYRGKTILDVDYAVLAEYPKIQ